MAQTDFYFQPGQTLDLGPPKQRVENNKQAIQLAKELTSTGRPASPDELALLSKYVGWGDSRLASRVHELTDLLTEDELRSARGSTLNAHYTALPVIGAMWEAALQLGFGERPFRALDPSAGIGHFKSMTPKSLREVVDWTEIELDGLTAMILKALHPNSRIFNTGFEAPNLPDGMFDLAISNVPFGDYGVFCKRLPKYLTNPIHDFFFANTWSLLRPGGVLMYITSRFTLDKKDDRVRSWLARRFDLLAAVRLPETAFEENAGTKVVTDILIMQKRIDETEDVPLWVNTGVFKPDYRAATVNQYYLEHPEMIIGVPSMDGRMYQSDGYTVLPAGLDLPAELSRTFQRVLTKLEPVPSPKNEEAIPVPFSDDTVISSRTPAMPVVASTLMEIHDAAKKLIRAETRGDRSNMTILRETLNRLYDQFVDLYGPINRPQNLRQLKNSAEVHFLKSLEKYHTESDTAKKSDIFFKTVVRSVVKNEKLSASDALLVCLDHMGKVDIPFIASLAQTSQDQVIEELRGSIFLEPQSLQWQTSEQYLSGNVRVKLQEAVAAAVFDARFQENVMALESVIPLTIDAGHIRAPLGAGWIPADVIGDFIKHLLKAGEYHATYIPALATWEIESENTAYIARNLLSAKWGTSRMNTLTLLDAGLNSRDVVVYNGFGKDRTVNTKETVAAQQKLLEIKEEFETWLWSDAERSKRLVDIYNEEFNSVRNVRYDGSHLTTPGLNQAIRLRSNQKDAAWRIIQNPATLIGHEVGMGKTLTAIVAAMESKRLGFTKKAMFVVPNHTLSNWQIVMQTAYPGANILLPDPSGLTKGKRSEFMSRIATNHWDMILVPFSSFKLLPVSSDTLKDFYLEQIDELEEHLLDLRGDKNSKRAVKEIEKALKRFQVKLETLESFEKDDEDTITFEELGVDMLITDEFHCLPYESKVLTDRGMIPIGEIVEKKLPVSVKSVDLTTNEIKWRPVTGWFNNPQSAPMVHIVHEKGEFKCTANHKVWTEEVGYVEAGKLTKDHTLKNLPSLRKGICAKNQRITRTKTSPLFPEMSVVCQTQDSDQELPALWKGIHVPVIRQNEQRQEKVLRKSLRGNMAHGTTRTKGVNEGVYASYVGSLAGRYERKTESCCISTYEDQQPNVQPRIKKTNVDPKKRSYIPCEGWQWEINQTTDGGSEGTKPANGICNTHSTGEWSIRVSADMLQSGCSRPLSKVGNRDRWDDPQHEEVEVFGQTKDGGTERSRVVSVTFLEPASGFRSGIGTRRDKRVYCLEVAETHNFFAEGVLVSNCYKNLYFTTKMTRIAGLTNSDSQRAFDMFVKFRWIIQHGGKVVGLTGTPVTNTIAEMFTMQRFFQLDTLKKLGLAQFDAWARQFALAEPGLEMTPDGAGFRMNTRFRKFVNVPELMQLWLQVADMRRIDPAEIQRPDLFKGKPVKVLSIAGQSLEDYVMKLAERAERVRSGIVRPDEDNMLCITGDGRKAALDLSLVIPQPAGAPMPKIDDLVEAVAEVWRLTESTKGTQLIFCDLGVPKAK